MKAQGRKFWITILGSSVFVLAEALYLALAFFSTTQFVPETTFLLLNHSLLLALWGMYLGINVWQKFGIAKVSLPKVAEIAQIKEK